MTAVLRSYAIKGSPNGKLLLEDIYYAIESRVGPEFHRIFSLDSGLTGFL